MIAGYPMVEEDQATGRVAAVYAAALERSPFVPSVLKSLALCPGFLVLAWQQALPVLESPEMADAADGLAASVRDAAAPPADHGDRELLGGFVEPLGRMLLLSCGLQAALEGALDGHPPAGADAPPAPRSPLNNAVPPLDDLEAAALFGRIRASLQTPIVNTIWRRAAAEGRLGEVWDQLEPQTPTTRPRADRLQRDALAAAPALPWEAVADPAALERAGIADAAPGMVAILRAYVVTLPRVLTLVACCGADGG